MKARQGWSSPAAIFSLNKVRRARWQTALWRWVVLSLLSAVIACSNQSNSDGGDGDAQAGPLQAAPALGHCIYTNRFVSSEECRVYTGPGWSEASATQACDDQGGLFTAGVACAYASTLGRCDINTEPQQAYVIVFPGNNADGCSFAKLGCETFAQGTFVAAPTCGGTPDDGGYGGGGGGSTVFLPPTLSCVEPHPGEPTPGQSEDGKVCTRTMIGGCTEDGRDFRDYAECSTVLTQRPYWPAPPNRPTPPEGRDPRLDDAAYLADVAWVKQQVGACGCVCCHTDGAPQGAANWNIDAGPLWLDTFFATGLAMGAGWIDSTSLGAYDAVDNNGFDRSVSGIPTTDNARMVRIFEQELSRLGYSREDFAGEEPFGGPLHQQSLFEPQACARGEGIDGDGVVRWAGGAARYLYVMAPDSANPGVPPNLDLPEGTLWRVDVAPSEAPLDSGSVTYGGTPPRGRQVFPEAQEAPPPSPQALTSGETYYLYVLADVGLPVTRCLFAAP